MEQRRNDAALKDAQIYPDEEEYVGDTMHAYHRASPVVITAQMKESSERKRETSTGDEEQTRAK